MARMRTYKDYSEAFTEWHRLGVPDGALGRLDLANKQFFFLDGLPKDDATPLIEAVRARGGRGFNCKGERTLVVLSPVALDAMLNNGEVLQMTEQLVTAAINRMTEDAPVFEWSGGSLDMSRPNVMGILNVTPDSFSDGGRFLDVDAAVRRAAEMKEEGADVIDIGGESTRPGSEPVPAEREWERIAEVVRRVSDEAGLPVSVDTRRPEVAEKALKAGASMVNDVSGLEPAMAEVVARAGCGAIIMHMKGRPADMQSDTRYADVVGDTYHFLEVRTAEAVRNGVPRASLAVDPGLGFGKDLEGNLQIMSRLDEYGSLGRPVVLGASRKTFLGKLSGGGTDDRLEGSLAAASVACWQGVRLFRVHDVKETVRTVRAVHAMRTSYRR